MTRESSQAALEPEGCLARMSRWATAFLVIPLLTGLSFAASTVLLSLVMPPGYDHYYPEKLSISIVCLFLGVGLGFPLRWAMMRIRATGWAEEGNWVVVLVIVIVLGVGLAWFVAGGAQIVLYYILTI